MIREESINHPEPPVLDRLREDNRRPFFRRMMTHVQNTWKAVQAKRQQRKPVLQSGPSTRTSCGVSSWSSLSARSLYNIRRIATTRWVGYRKTGIEMKTPWQHLATAIVRFGAESCIKASFSQIHNSLNSSTLDIYNNFSAMIPNPSLHSLFAKSLRNPVAFRISSPLVFRLATIWQQRRLAAA